MKYLARSEVRPFKLLAKGGNNLPKIFPKIELKSCCFRQYFKVNK